VDDICLNQPEQGHGIEACLDIETAISEAIQLAWKKGDRKSTIAIRDESGIVEAVVMTDAELAALVLRADGTLVVHPRWAIL